MFTLRQIARDLSGMIVVVGLLFLVTFLPPDTSLKQVRDNNAIRVCVPTSYPPLVTGDPERPGIDVEILQAVADHVGVRLLLSPNDAMGRDFNPRNWAINRAKCELLAGGVVDSTLTRSFLDTGPPYAQTGWSIVAPAPLEEIGGRTVGALTLVSGLDRIGLFHLNDSKGALGSRRDRHENIGEGELGLEPFARLLNDPAFSDVPKVLETPKGDDVVAADRNNLARLRALRDTVIAVTDDRDGNAGTKSA